MKPFADLSYSGQVKRLKQLAQKALLNYNLASVDLVSLDHGENTTFKVKVRSNQSSQTLKEPNQWYVLRIYRANKHNIAAIHSELLWLVSLRRETDLVVPEPIPTRSGSLFEFVEAARVPEPRCCALFRWLGGRTVRAGLNVRLIERVGFFLARLHQHSQQFVPPKGFVRPRLDENGLLGAFPITLPIESEVLVSPQNQAVLQAAALQIRDRMQCLEQQSESFGLIHGDLHLGNCKFHKGKVQVFDFDDCGWGYYLYDLAVTLYYLRNRSEFPALREALLKGYQQQFSLSKQHESCLEAMMAARHLHLMRDIFLRQDNPKLQVLTPKYIDASIEEMKKFLNQ
jgi:Ser/Thr protein kinase RdoA (MazF antagonist)